MILQIEKSRADQPRISSNQLGEYIYATPKRKFRILENQKFGNKFCAPYYSPALQGIMHSFKNGTFVEENLDQSMEVIKASEAEKNYHIKKRENNVAAIKNFMEIGQCVNPPEGNHRIVSRNALVPLDGVIVSARPEIITENNRLGYAAFTKLRISKSKVSADAQEIVLLVLLHYGQQQSYDGLTFDLEKSKLIDCFSKSIVAGHNIGRHRHHQLHQALSEIRTLWPTIRPRGDS